MNKIYLKILLLLSIFYFFLLIKKNSLIYEGFSCNKLVMIIPIRDREDDLKDILEKIRLIFKYQNIDYKILIIEQSKNKNFNKGKINNVGFIEATKYFPDYDNFLFNDVDNYPKYNKIINYKVNVKGFHHLFGNEKWLGGFYITNKYFFKKVNGYSNNFWGWGGEDKDLQARVDSLNIPIIRSIFYERINQNVIEDTGYNVNNKKWKKNIDRYKPIYEKNLKNYNKKHYLLTYGLTTTNYKILNTKIINKNIVRLLVDI